MPRSSLLLPAITGALALGCGDQQSPTPAAESPAPSLSVERVTASFAFGFGNDERLVIIGTTLENWLTFCETSQENFEEWEELHGHSPGWVP